MSQLFYGNSLEVLKGLASNSVDAVVTDPPYGLEFMGKDWDAPWKSDRRQTFDGTLTDTRDNPYGRSKVRNGNGASYGADARQMQEFQRWCELWAAELLRVLKPGGHLLAFGGARTYHRLACAIEDAGFEIRDCVMYLYGSGFPKSLSVYKATLKTLESRYGKSTCNCLDEGNGQPAGDNGGLSDREEIRVHGTSGISPTQEARDSIVSLEARGGADPMCDLRERSTPEAKGFQEVKAAVLFQDVREYSTEESRLGDSSIWSRMEKPESGDSSTRQSMPDVLENTGRERLGSPCPPSEAFPVRGDQPSSQSRGTMRFLSPQDREDNRTGFISDSDRREPRRIIVDNLCGWKTAMAYVCSWCGRPANEWLESLRPLGTALKPAHEPIVVARKPLDGTVAANVLKWGTGAVNVDGCRVEGVGGAKWETPRGGIWTTNSEAKSVLIQNEKGRWPANLIHDGSEEVLACFPDSKGQQGDVRGDEPSAKTNNAHGDFAGRGATTARNDSGSAARFFYCAKASKSERGTGNTHPTVKPLALMRYLCRLVTPPGGAVLDPFLGSGTTGVACAALGYDFIGIEKDAEYFAFAKQRIEQKEAEQQAALEALLA